MASKRLRLKKEVTELLRSSDLAWIKDQLRCYRPADLLNPLFSTLCHYDELVRWHGVSGLGFVVGRLAFDDLEQARVVMRRFLWMLNDESGGIGWGVPEAMAESMAGSPELAEEYLHLLVSYTIDDGPELMQQGNFLEHPSLQEGVLWGLCRLADECSEALLACGLAETIGVYFASDYGGVRGQVCRLCGMMRLERYRQELTALEDDPAPVRLYRYTDGTVHNETVAALASWARRRFDLNQSGRMPGGIGATDSEPRQ